MSEESHGRSARDRAIDALARREHSRQELARKLTRQGVVADDIVQALERLAEEGLQDDGRFVQAYIAQRARRGYGPRRITAELRERGIDPERINEGLAAVEFDWRSLARDARNKKFNEPPQDMAERARQTRFLEYRGFFAEHIRHALGLAVDDEDL